MLHQLPFTTAWEKMYSRVVQATNSANWSKLEPEVEVPRGYEVLEASKYDIVQRGALYVRMLRTKNHVIRHLLHEDVIEQELDKAEEWLWELLGEPKPPLWGIFKGWVIAYHPNFSDPITPPSQNFAADITLDAGGYSFLLF